MAEAEQATPELDELDQSISDALAESEESAPQTDENTEPEEVESQADGESNGDDKKPVDNFQKRINKVTADKWEEKRRADALQKKLDDIEAAKPQSSELVEPTLESFEFDDDKYQSALVDYRVDKRLRANDVKQQEDYEVKASEARTAKFLENAEGLAKEKEDFTEVLRNMPTLQPTVLAAVMEDPKGPELAYYLGKHLDITDKIVSMNPIAAAIEIGRISQRLAEPKQIKPSSAPDPISAVSSGGVVSSNIGDEMSTAEWMKKYNP